MLSFPMNTLVSSLMTVAEAAASAASTRSSLMFSRCTTVTRTPQAALFIPTASICLIITARVIIYCCSFIDNLLGVLMSDGDRRSGFVASPLCEGTSCWKDVKAGR